MKILLLCPSIYSVHKTLKRGFEKLGCEVYHHDYRLLLKPWQKRLNIQIFRLPFTYRIKWERYYFTLINNTHKEIFDRVEPDIVFIYNNEMFLPETLKYFKSRNAKIIFFMGDMPYFTPTNHYYLHLLFKADKIVSPDSFWAEQLNMLGINNVIVDFPVYDDSLINFREPTREERLKYDFDVLFVGGGYANTWGYKRTLFVSKFKDINLKIYGTKHWLKWFEFFPELEPHFELLTNRISEEQLIIMSKCAKVYPVDANPAILNGVHLRIFDCIASGVLPLVEFRKDHLSFFEGVDLPLIRNYNESEQIARRYINNDQLRETTLKELRGFLFEKFRSDIVLKRILERL